MIARIPVPPKFNFPSTVVSHGWYLLAPFRWSPDERVLRRVEILGGKPVKLAISCDGESLLVDGARDTAELRTKLGRMFQLGVDTSEFAMLAGNSPDHLWVVRAGFGRLLCGATLFEDVAKIIATTNTMWSQTTRMVQLLVEKCGRGGAFPEPEDVARFSADELQRDCRLGYRAKTLHALASGMADGSISRSGQAEACPTSEQLFKEYQKLPGIGPYGAAHLLAMDGRHDFIAVDTEFRRFVRERYHKGRAVADATMLRRYKKWGRWKYLAYWSELWSSIAERLVERGQ